MVELTAQEHKHIESLELRLVYLLERTKGDGPQRSQEVRELRAVLWLLEIVTHAKLNDCHESFLFTQSRTKEMDRRRERQAAQRLARIKRERQAARQARPTPYLQPWKDPLRCCA